MPLPRTASTQNITPTARFREPIVVASLSQFTIQEYPYAFGALPTEDYSLPSENDFLIGETISLPSENDFIVTVEVVDTPIAFWEFEDTSWADSSGNGYALSTAGGSPTVTTGTVGNALRCSTSGALLELLTDEFNYFGLATASTFTVEGYVRFSNISTGRYFFRINRCCEIAISGTSFTWLVRNNGVIPTTVTNTLVTVTTGTWYNFVCKYLGSTLECTINGSTASASFSGIIEDDSFGNTVNVRGLANGNTDIDQLKITKS